MIRTSQTDPLLIDELAYPEGSGRIGLAMCPGKCSPGGLAGAWARDLAGDLDLIRDWPAATVVTLIEDHEFGLLQVEGLPDEVRARGMTWLHFPIIDRSAPDTRFLEAWREEGPHVTSAAAAMRSPGPRVPAALPGPGGKGMRSQCFAWQWCRTHHRGPGRRESPRFFASTTRNG